MATLGIPDDELPQQQREATEMAAETKDASEFSKRIGRCYELSGRKVADSGDAEDLRLVHGSIQGFGNPRIGHAWVLGDAGLVWEPITDRWMPEELFVIMFDPMPCETYGVDGACVMLVTAGHWGPWHVGEFGLDGPVQVLVKESN